MRTICNILFFLSLSAAIAQNPVEVNIPAFSNLKVFDLITVNLKPSNTNKIVITGDDAQDVEYVLSNDLLKVRMKTNKIFNGSKTIIDVYYTDITVLDANEGATITANEVIKQSQLSIAVQEGARVSAVLDIENLKLRAVTGGIIEARGNTKFQEVTVNTGGVVENEQLVSNHSTVKVQAGGTVHVYATKSVDVNVRAGGDVYVSGNPEKVNKKTLLGGSIVVE